jgi:hypothetical protein
MLGFAAAVLPVSVGLTPWVELLFPAWILLLSIDILRTGLRGARGAGGTAIGAQGEARGASWRTLWPHPKQYGRQQAGRPQRGTPRHASPASTRVSRLLPVTTPAGGPRPTLMAVLADLSAHRIRRASKEQNRAIGALGSATKFPAADTPNRRSARMGLSDGAMGANHE